MTVSDWIQAAVAAGTLLAVFVAVWGDLIRSWLAAPRLVVHLRNPEGELGKQQDGKQVRYYHVDVSNARQWARARNVTVYINRIETIGVDRQWRAAMDYGPIPLHWKFGMAPAYIGRATSCDVAFVVEGGELQPVALFLPLYLPAALKGKNQFRYHLAAVADNAESPICVLEFSWDGTWVDGAKEMAGHLVVKEVSTTAHTHSF